MEYNFLNVGPLRGDFGESGDDIGKLTGAALIGPDIDLDVVKRVCAYLNEGDVSIVAGDGYVFAVADGLIHLIVDALGCALDEMVL